MFGIRTSVIIALLSLLLNGASAAGCGSGNAPQQSRQDNRAGNKNATPTPKEGESGDIKILTQGAYNSVSESFVAVARDAETYRELRRLDDNLPILSSEAFKRAAVVAAFLGQRRSGGFGVEIKRSTDGALRINETKPPPGSMSTQALTTPYKIVLVPIENERPLRLELDKSWREGTRPYKVAAGEFTMSGGFAGRSENMRLAGSLAVMRHANLATFIFDLKGTGGSKVRELKEAATGLVQAGGELRLARFNAGSLVEPPENLLEAKGQFSNNESDLTLSFESLPSNINDGYQGRGRLTATATGPPPPKRALNRESVM
ncbi:MAG TPA: protease complex subunit PrcB family protein [Pyrinomonadaceae bacterium]